MKKVLLLKCGELILKGLNRAEFEKRLIKNIKIAAAKHGEYKIYCAQSTIYVEAADEFSDIDIAREALTKVFGITSICTAAFCEKDMSDICLVCDEYLGEKIKNAKSFRVTAKRSDKGFALKSPQISQELGGYLFEKYNTKVDLKNAALTITCEVRDFGAYVHADAIPGAKGLPCGTGGRAMLLLSGGIDSPVAGYMIAKRGVQLEAVHFFSYPYTSERAKMKVLDLAKIMAGYCSSIRVHVIPFTKIQEEIRDRCSEEYFTLVMRRFMMMISERIAVNSHCDALITGESLGQVASQTMLALGVTNNAVNMPVFRPLIGMDKQEIVETAYKINTFETSILPYEDCCTVFTPKHPKTKPLLCDVIKQENRLDMQKLIDEAVENEEIIVCR